MARNTLAFGMLALGWVAGCSDLSGDWEGGCDYEGPSGDRDVRLVITLGELSDKGLGEGSGKIIDDGDSVKADVVYQSSDNDSVSIDVYPDKGKDLFLRGSVRKGSLVGSCGDEPPTTVNVEEMLNCVSSVDPNCEDASAWKPGKRPAPVSADDLSGRFDLDRQ